MGREYIEDLARKITRTLRLFLAPFSGTKEQLPPILWREWGPDVQKYCAKEFNIGTLAKIFAYGLDMCGRDSEGHLYQDKTKLVDVIDINEWSVSLGQGGSPLQLQVATITIVAAMADVLWADLQKAKAEAARPKLATVDACARSERMFSEGDRFIAYCQSSVGGHWYFQSIQSQDLKLIIGCQFSLSARETEKKVELLKSKIASWASTEKELTIVLEVVEVTNRPVKGAVLFTHTCGPAPSVQEMVDRCAENLRRDLGRSGP